jgi:hypothetical protein
MTGVTKIIGAITNLGLDQRVKQARFVRHSTNRSRQYGQSLLVVNIQPRKWNSRESGKFTINLGVHFSGVAELPYGKDPMPKNPKEFNRILRARAGMPMNNPHDRWWTAAPETDVAATAAEVAATCSKESFRGWSSRANQIMRGLKRQFGKPSDRWNCKNGQLNRVW